MKKTKKAQFLGHGRFWHQAMPSCVGVTDGRQTVGTHIGYFVPNGTICQEVLKNYYSSIKLVITRATISKIN